MILLKQLMHPRIVMNVMNCFLLKMVFIHFCNTLKNKKGPKLSVVENRKDIYNFFIKEYDKLPISKKCKFCIYFLRRRCNGMCFRKIATAS